MRGHSHRILAVLFALLPALVSGTFYRWEERTIDCTAGPRAADCLLSAPTARKTRNTRDYPCREEPMEHPVYNHLAVNSTTRRACPLGCEPDANLSVLQKKPYNDSKCIKYYTYGKYRENNEWYLWITPPCTAVITTHCRFPNEN